MLKWENCLVAKRKGIPLVVLFVFLIVLPLNVYASSSSNGLAGQESLQTAKVMSEQLNAGTVQDGDYTYTVTAGKAQITEYTGVGGVVTIPSTLGGVPVKSIGNKAFYYNTGLTSISIPQGVTSIGDRSFNGCTGLTSINIPQGVISIGFGAFQSCSGLTTISIPQGVTTIGSYSFSFCTGLSTISIPQGVTSIGSSAFSGCTGLSTISIPQGVTIIDGFVFQGCTGLTTINIPQTVTSIGLGAFLDCTGLTTISIPQGVTIISGSAFSGCTGLTTIIFNSPTTIIVDNANTIPSTTKIKGYTPSTAKIYATKYNREFETIATLIAPITPDTITGVSLNKSVTSLKVGANETFIATISPSNATNKGFTWDSSNPAIATVDTNGKVVAVSVGTVVITITTVDGSKTATCTVTVNASQTPTSNRLSGHDRFQTAKAISEQFNSGTVQDVIITSGNNFPDALSASVLAKKLNAPILLVDSKVQGSSEAFNYISQHLNKSGTIHIIGGTTIIGSDFEAQLIQLGYQGIERIGGYDRYDTNVLIAQKLAVAKNTPVVFASGENFPDALSISSIASSKGWPILLVGKDYLAQGIKDYVSNEQPSQVYIVGGTSVVSENVKSQIQSCVPNTPITRLAGQDRFDTNASIIQTFAPNPKNIYFATGFGFADALAGSVLAAMTGDPIVLVDPNSYTLPSKIVTYLSNINDSKNTAQIVTLGGSTVVPDSQMNSANSIFNVANEGAKLTSGVNLNKTSTAINVGANDTLTASIVTTDSKTNATSNENATPNNVSWMSSNTAVATVDTNGNVVGVNAGTAVITVTTLDGSYTAACTVNVSSQSVVPTPTPITPTPTTPTANDINIQMQLNYLRTQAAMIQKEINAVKSDTSHELITDNGQRIFTYDTARVAELTILLNYWNEQIRLVQLLK